MAVSDRIRDIRKRNGMSQSAFGKLLGVSNSTISECESGNRGVPIDAIDQIVKALNVSVHYLMDWAENADALAPANALSQEALHVARVYDTLDAPGKELLTWITNHEAARIAASEPDEFKIARQAIDAASAANAAAPEQSESTG